MKRAFSTLCCLDFGLGEILRLAKDSHIDAVELRVDDRLLESFENTEEARKLFDTHGIYVSDIASSIFIRNDVLPQTCEGYIKLAVALGSRAVRVFAASDSNGVLDLSRIAEGFKKLCDIAEIHGIEIWLETHSELSTGKKCRQLLDLADRKNLKILWDVMHSLEHGESLDETYELIGEQITHVHLKDGFPSDDKTEYILCALGEGMFPFSELAEILRKNCYNGCLSLEWETPWCPHLRGIYKDEHELLQTYNKILDKAGFNT